MPVQYQPPNPKCPRDAVQAHHRRLAVACHPMPVDRWRQIKGAFYALLIAGVAAFSIWFDADATLVGIAALVAIITVLGGELEEIRIANWATIMFDSRRRRGQSQPESAENADDDSDG